MTGLPAPTERADVIVLGSGGAGLVAALTCARAGLEVLVLESRAVVGGTTAMSGAALWVPGNRLAAAGGIPDTPDEVAAYLAAVAPEGWAAEEAPLWRAFAENAPRMLALLEAATALRFVLSDDSDPFPLAPGGRRSGRIVSVAPQALPERLPQQRPHIPHYLSYPELRRFDPWNRPVSALLRNAPQLAWRLLRGQRAQGTALVRGLVNGCLDAGVRFRTGCRARTLVRDGRGAIAGVRCEPDGAVFAAPFVVIATGGFERDETRRAAHFAGPVDLIGSSPGNLGDGQAMAEAAGAQLARMDQANIAPALPAMLDGAPLPIGTFHHRMPGAILVDRNGQRFVNEYLFNLGEVLAERDAEGAARHLPAWLVFDNRSLRRSPMLRRTLRAAPPGYHLSARTPEALADRIGVAPITLAGTLERFNGFAAAGEDAEFARHLDALTGEVDGVPRLAPIAKPPFHALPFNLSFLGTKGGPRTDDGGRVISTSGAPIPGLFACGLAMANPIGTRAASSGTTLGPNLTWGFICGTTIAAEAASRNDHGKAVA